MTDYEYESVPLFVSSMDENGVLEASVPGRFEAQALNVRDLHYGVREYIVRRLRYGDLPIVFGIRPAKDATSLKAALPEDLRLWTLPAPPPFTTLDFRRITRDPDRLRCKIVVDLGYPYYEKVWIRAGSVDLTENDRGVATIKAYLPRGVTDFEHDSSYAFNFDLIGLRFENTFYGQTRFQAYLHPDIEHFNVPDSDYNPMESDEAWMCQECPKPHPMLPDGFFVPKPTEKGKKLFRMLQGKKLTITIGTPPRDDDE